MAIVEYKASVPLKVFATYFPESVGCTACDPWNEAVPGSIEDWIKH